MHALDVLCYDMILSLSLTQSFSLSIAGERLTKRIRLKTFQAILKQEIGWFDQRSHSTGALATRLATDAAELKGVRQWP